MSKFEKADSSIVSHEVVIERFLKLLARSQELTERSASVCHFASLAIQNSSIAKSNAKSVQVALESWKQRFGGVMK